MRAKTSNSANPTAKINVSSGTIFHDSSRNVENILVSGEVHLVFSAIRICASTVLCLILLTHYNQDAGGRTNAGRGRRGGNLCLPS
ncbi:hypothetical protein CDAR_409141 [Caerostris darwini]|uniref:Uncharacterized protein n=1 Tax=Caerostris darwini TaxID=1538125 RepID=A0AAV4P8G7_9ARAC|nr:hypothetical protein CDAR_409141 [Caerostris darwini]